MDFDVERLSAAVLRLPAAEHAALVACLLDSLNASDAGEPGVTHAEWEAAWAAECDRRESADPATDILADEAFRGAHAGSALSAVTIPPAGFAAELGR